jgi:hypothetical protein
MKNRILLLVLVASLPIACRALEESSQPAAQPKAQPMAPILSMPVAQAPQAEKPAPVLADSRSERFAVLEKEQSDALNAYRDAFRKALGDNKNPTQEDYQKIQEQVHQPDTEGYSARAQKLLDEDATDITAFHAIQFLLDNARGAETGPALLALLEKHHMDRPEMGDMCSRLVQNGRGLLEKLAASSPHQDVRGRACCTMADSLKSDIQTAEYIQGKSQQELDGMKGWLGDEKLAALQKLDVDATQKEIERIYERVVNEFSDVKLNAGSKRETTLGKRAGTALYEIRNLCVGKTTPEIEGVDLDSVAFKLSDYRGKVVLLDFWGNW